MYMILCRVNKQILSQFFKNSACQNSIFINMQFADVDEAQRAESDCNQSKTPVVLPRHSINVPGEHKPSGDIFVL